MVRYRAVCTLAFVVAGPWAYAQDTDSPYRIELRNVAPFVPERGVVLDLPRRDAEEGAHALTIHALVQLDADQIAQPDAAGRLRRLFTAAPNAPLRLQRNVQKATYQAVIRRDVAERMSRERSFDALAAVDRDAAALVRWIGSFPREAKLEAALLSGRYQPWGIGEGDTFRLLVTFYEDAVGDAERVLRGLAREHLPYSADTWRVVLDRDRLEDLVAEDSVRSVAMGPKPFTPLNDLTRGVVHVQTAQNANVATNPPSYQGLTGEGVTVAVMDLGVANDHDDFWEHDAAGMPTVSRVQHFTTGVPDDSHGTHIAGVIAGSGHRSMPNGGTAYQWRGMAPHAKIASFANVNSGGDTTIGFEATVTGGADLTNESHEQEECLIYDQVAATVDGLVRGTETHPVTSAPIPRRASVWAAGNNGVAAINAGRCENYGYFGLTVAAKNPIVVGSVYLDNNGQWIARNSSLGPTYDGRLKPDIVAPGCAIGSSPVGVKSTALHNDYEQGCGTSVATAVVSGIAALLLEKWREELESASACTPTAGGECFPMPSTLKTLLIQGASDRTLVIPYPNGTPNYSNPDTGAKLQYHTGPDYATGYGLVDAAASIAILDAGVVGSGHRVLEDVTSSGTMPDVHFVVVPPNQTRLRVTLAWDDPPGDELLGFTVSQLVNDLDLELERVPQTGDPPDPAPIKLPWTLPALTPNANAPLRPDLPDPVSGANIQPAVKTAVDTRNNVEQVEVSNPAQGTWRVRVKGAKLPSDASQQYSLASDFPFVSAFAPPVLPRPPGGAAAELPSAACQELDWGRTPGGGGFSFQFDPTASCGLIPLEPICRYVVNCAVCERFESCPQLRMRLTLVPEVFAVELRRKDGTRVAADDSSGRVKTLSWQPVAGEEYGLFFNVARGARPPAERQRVGIDVTAQR